MATQEHHDYGVLVGWVSQALGNRVSLHMQSVAKGPPHKGEDVQTQVYLMDKNQAAQLANYLFEIANTTPPDTRRRGVIARLFG